MWRSMAFGRQARQLPRAAVLLQPHHHQPVLLARHFAASASTPPAEEQDPLKRIFFNMMKKYRTFVDGLASSKVTLDPDDPQAVSEYRGLMDNIRKAVGAPTRTQKIRMILDKEAEAAPDVKTFFKFLPKLKAKMGITQDYEGDKMMLEAVEKVEKMIGRTLVRQDKEGMRLLKKEFEAINKALGVSPKQVKDLANQLETECAKADLEKMKNEVAETIEAHKKSLEMEEIQVDLRTLDHRKYL